MAQWKNDDREESKPTWLSLAQRRQCVRTNRGWELPVGGSVSGLAGQFRGQLNLGGQTAFIPQWEVIVTLPNDPAFGNGVTGPASAAYTARNTATFAGSTFAYDNSSTTGAAGGATSGYAPYISCPFQGDSATAGGRDSTGLSHDRTSNYGVNAYHVSTLNWPRNGLTGVTGYIKVQAQSVNPTRTLTISVTGPSGGGAGWDFYTGSAVLTTTNVPAAVYEAMFGPTSAYNLDIGVIRLGQLMMTGAGRVYGLTASVNDGVNGYTGTSFFKISVV